MEVRGCVRCDRCGATVRLAFEGNEREVRTLDVAFGADRSCHTQRRHIGAIEQWRTDIGGIEDGETVYGMPVACGAQKGGGGLAIMESDRVRPEVFGKAHAGSHFEAGSGRLQRSEQVNDRGLIGCAGGGWNFIAARSVDEFLQQVRHGVARGCGRMPGQRRQVEIRCEPEQWASDRRGYGGSGGAKLGRSEEHTSELKSLMRTTY